MSRTRLQSCNALVEKTSFVIRGGSIKRRPGPYNAPPLTVSSTKLPIVCGYTFPEAPSPVHEARARTPPPSPPELILSVDSPARHSMLSIDSMTRSESGNSSVSDLEAKLEELFKTVQEHQQVTSDVRGLNGSLQIQIDELKATAFAQLDTIAMLTAQHHTRETHHKTVVLVMRQLLEHQHKEIDSLQRGLMELQNEVRLMATDKQPEELQWRHELLFGTAPL